MANNKNSNVVNSETKVDSVDIKKENIEQNAGDTAVEESKLSTAVNTESKTEVSDLLNTIKSGMKDKTPDATAKSTKPEVITINPDEEIDIRSCITGGLNWVSKVSGIHYHWLDFNDIQLMKFSDLEYMRRNSSHHIDKPNVIIDDERVIKKFRLIPLYTQVAETMQVESAVNNIERMVAICKNARLINMRDLIVDKLTSLISDGVLTNFKVIKAAEEALNYKFDIE